MCNRFVPSSLPQHRLLRRKLLSLPEKRVQLQDSRKSRLTTEQSQSCEPLSSQSDFKERKGSPAAAVLRASEGRAAHVCACCGERRERKANPPASSLCFPCVCLFPFRLCCCFFSCCWLLLQAAGQRPVKKEQRKRSCCFSQLWFIQHPENPHSNTHLLHRLLHVMMQIRGSPVTRFNSRPTEMTTFTTSEEYCS